MTPLSSVRIKQLTLAACIIGSGIAVLDGTVVNIALPTIQRDLGGGLAGQQWVSNAYLLTLSSLILVGGSLGDLFGERRVFALGVGGFGAASLLCALAPTIGFLIAFRALQGVAGALLIPSSLAVIVATFPESERGAAIGTWTAFGAIAAAIGPLGGGLLLGIGSWRWIFLVNLPFVAACLVLILAVIPRAAPIEGARHAVDLIGALLCALGLGGPVFALIEQPRLGWSSPAVAVPLIAGVLLFVAFLVYESRARQPMLPLGLFARRNFAVGNVETFAMYAGLAVLFFFLVLYLQQVAGYTPLQSGLATLPVTIVMLSLSRRFGGLADRFGPRLFMGLGPMVAGVGLLALLRVGIHVDYLGEVLPGLLIFSLGLSMTVAPLTAAVLAGVEERQAGTASGVNNAVARVAGLLGIAALGAIVAIQFGASLDRRLAGTPLAAPGRAAVAQAKQLTLGRPSVAGLPPRQARMILAAANGASLESFRVGIGIAGGLVVLGGLIGAVGIQNPPRTVSAEECAGGQLVGASPDAAGCHAIPDPVQPGGALA
ncbi:MAG TPA: DHA2 family efflux MFS transporter permease subunit [Solirubrobacteraceae bacterium]|jgi:EmrB/QacA subfamily drug resistance transporter|nr:DHA2 family efflux MFS transporter permease subunit [Solirubrobacteraceae bacterium]